MRQHDDDWDDDDDDDDDAATPELAEIAKIALGELLNIAASVAELQVSEESAGEIYALCDLVAGVYGITREQMIETEQEDGSIRIDWVEVPPPTIELGDNTAENPPGHVRWEGRSKWRFRDKDDD